MSDHNFKGTIWTNHALQKLKERGIKQGDAWSVWRRPEQSRKGKDGSWIYYRTIPTSPRLRGAGGYERIEVVAKQNEKKEWLILSVWSKPVYQKTPKTLSLFKFLFRRIFGK